jgi:hypothetical protein
VIKPADLSAAQRQTFNMWRRLGLSEESSLRAMEQDGVIAVSEEERQARVFRSAFGLTEEGARRAVEGRDGGRAVSEPVSEGSGSGPGLRGVLEELSDDELGQLLEAERRRREAASGK